MPRFALLIEYDGGPYCGFQLQDGVPTVQGVLARAIEAFSGERPVIHVAGRTDTGVHALGQVAHIELSKAWPEKTVREAINAHLVPEPVAVLAAKAVDDEFHARFSAIGRRYIYRLINRPAPPALDFGRVWRIKKPLDEAAMQAGAEVLIGTHDFTTFRDVNCQSASPVKTMDAIRIERAGEEVHLHFAARSFLHRQVRSITGSLVEVGLGRWSIADLQAALEARSRDACGPVAPPDGLYLTAVEYGGAVF